MKYKIKTIHIKGVNNYRYLLKTLYETYLKEDPLWHFVFWKDLATHKGYMEGSHLLIRVSTDAALAQVQDHLASYPYEVEVYDYPQVRGKYRLGQLSTSWEVKHPDVALSMDHACSVAALTLSKTAWPRFLSQFVHIACNTRGWNHHHEAYYLSRILSNKIAILDQWKTK